MRERKLSQSQLGSNQTQLEKLIQAALAAPSALREEAFRVLSGTPTVTPNDANIVSVEPYLSLRELAKRIGYSTCTLWRWNIPGYNLGGRRRFRLTEVHRYLQSEEFQRRAAALRGERKLKATGIAGQTPNSAPTV